MVLFFSNAYFTNNDFRFFSAERIKHNLLLSYQLVVVWELVEKYIGAIFDVFLFLCLLISCTIYYVQSALGSYGSVYWDCVLTMWLLDSNATECSLPHFQPYHAGHVFCLPLIAFIGSAWIRGHVPKFCFRCWSTGL